MVGFDDFEYNKELFPKDEEENRLYFKQLQAKFIEEINNSEKAKEFFKKYREDSIESFVKYYVHHKAMLVQYYDYYNRLYEEFEHYDHQYQKKAEHALLAILQKKLFNMQILWRANQLKINGIEMGYDFQFWERHIKSCPFIPPIEEHEKDLMKQYLQNTDNLENDFFDSHFFWWQDYYELTQKYDDDSMDNMIDWYEYYDSILGTGALLNLPNIRYDLEEFYMNLAREERKKEFEKNNAASNPVKIDKRKSLHSFGYDFFKFAKYYETDKHFLQLFRASEYNHKKDDRDPPPEAIEHAIDILETADRKVYLPSHLNWDEAIIAGANKYVNTKIAESLDAAYDEYKMLIELGMFADKSEEEIKKLYEKDDIVKMYRNSILMGRRLNGEPEDFNF